MSTFKKAFGSATLGGLGGVVALYLLSHFDPSVFSGTLGEVVALVVAAVTTALTHHAQTKP